MFVVISPSTSVLAAAEVERATTTTNSARSIRADRRVLRSEKNMTFIPLDRSRFHSLAAT